MTTQADYNNVYVSRYAARDGMRVESRHQGGDLILDESWGDFQSLIRAGQLLLRKTRAQDRAPAAQRKETV